MHVFTRGFNFLPSMSDKLKRTALIHACMSGQAHVVAYLLSLGANPNQADSSGNTCIHYAAAYGWYFCMKVLLESGADPNAPNDWKVSITLKAVIYSFISDFSTGTAEIFNK